MYACMYSSNLIYFIEKGRFFGSESEDTCEQVGRQRAVGEKRVDFGISPPCLNFFPVAV